jgi:thiol-disulfide isomerase/thioredoxin
MPASAQSFLRGPRAVLAILALSLACVAAGGPQDAPGWWLRLGVKGLDGAPLVPAGRRIVVVFISGECPVSNAYIPVLNRLASDFAGRGFAFVGAYVDPESALPALREHARAYGITFAAADDRGHRLVKAAAATLTPEAVVFSEAGAVLYRGRIDDRVGELGSARPAAAHNDLRDVLEAVASGNAGPFPPKPGFGCFIPEKVGN